MTAAITCPDCGRRMIYVAMVADGYIFHTWQCDCHYRTDLEYVPPEVVHEICTAREWDDGSLVYEVDLLYAEEPDVKA